MRPTIAAILLILSALLLTFEGGSLIWQKRQRDLRLELVKNDLDIFWNKLNRTGTAVAGQSVEIQHLWENQKRAEEEHRQEIVRLINEQRQLVNRQTPDVYPLLELKTNPILEQSARQAFENIAETKRFEHQDMTALLARGEPFDRVGENLAAEVNVNPVRTVYDFYLSGIHREVMLGDWEYIGVWSGWVEDLVVEGKEPQDFYVTVVHFGE